MALAQSVAQIAATKGVLIRIGLIVPLTGVSSDLGNSARIGAEVAIGDINQIGGLLDRPLERVLRGGSGRVLHGSNRAAKYLFEPQSNVFI